MHLSTVLPLAVGSAMAAVGYQLENDKGNKQTIALIAGAIGVAATIALRSNPYIFLGLTVASTAYLSQKHVTKWMNGNKDLNFTKLSGNLIFGMGFGALGCGVARMGMGAINFARSFRG